MSSAADSQPASSPLSSNGESLHRQHSKLYLSTDPTHTLSHTTSLTTMLSAQSSTAISLCTHRPSPMLEAGASQTQGTADLCPMTTPAAVLQCTQCEGAFATSKSSFLGVMPLKAGSRMRNTLSSTSCQQQQGQEPSGKDRHHPELRLMRQPYVLSPCNADCAAGWG